MVPTKEVLVLIPNSSYEITGTDNPEALMMFKMNRRLKLPHMIAGSNPDAVIFDTLSTQRALNSRNCSGGNATSVMPLC